MDTNLTSDKFQCISKKYNFRQYICLQCPIIRQQLQNISDAEFIIFVYVQVELQQQCQD